MKKIKILITGAGSGVGQSIAKSLKIRQKRDLFKGVFLKSKYIYILLSAIFRGCKTQEENNKKIIKKKNKFLEYLNNKVNEFFWYINRFFNILSL